ncbi:hypothetical protein AOQ84DRAFT_223970, partial [Glonium stellatum]
ANKHGMDLGARLHGVSTDAMSAVTALAIAEGEALRFKSLNNYKPLADVHMALKMIILNESAAFADAVYSTTFEKVFRPLDPIFVAGVNRTTHATEKRRQVATRADMEAGIAKLGLQPGATYSNQSQLLCSYRVENDIDNYFFRAPATVKVDADVTMPWTGSRAAPFILDPWSDSTVNAPLHGIEKDGHVRLHLAVTVNQSALITLAHNTRKSGIAG